jgi:predicted RNase H-like HicB family nuclease
MNDLSDLTSIIFADADGGYVSECPELGVASQGESIDEARAMLVEAVELTLECADQDEIRSRLDGSYLSNSQFTEEELMEGLEEVESRPLPINADILGAAGS